MSTNIYFRRQFLFSLLKNIFRGPTKGVDNKQVGFKRFRNNNLLVPKTLKVESGQIENPELRKHYYIIIDYKDVGPTIMG